jgi:hypothetical protein
MFDLTEKEIALVRTFNDAFNYDCAEDEINDNATAIDLKDFVRSTGMPELTVLRPLTTGGINEHTRFLFKYY